MRATAIPLTLLASAISACSEQPLTTEAVDMTPVTASGKPVTLPTVSLIVTVADAPYRIQSDGKGDYSDGTQNVQAVLDQYGTFAFNTNTSRRSATRWVNYDFGDPVDPSNTYRPSPSPTRNYHFSTGPSAFRLWRSRALMRSGRSR